MKKIKFFSFLILAAAMIYVYGCGDDAVNNNTGGTGSVPNIDFKTGSGFTFTFDTLSRVNGTSVRLTNMTSRDSIETSFPVGSNTAYRIVSRRLKRCRRFRGSRPGAGASRVAAGSTRGMAGPAPGTGYV